MKTAFPHYSFSCWLFICALGAAVRWRLMLSVQNPLRGSACEQLLEELVWRSRWWPQEPLMGRPWWMTSITAEDPPPSEGPSSAGGRWLLNHSSPLPKKAPFHLHWTVSSGWRHSLVNVVHLISLNPVGDAIDLNQVMDLGQESRKIW